MSSDSSSVFLLLFCRHSYVFLAANFYPYLSLKTKLCKFSVPAQTSSLGSFHYYLGDARISYSALGLEDIAISTVFYPVSYTQQTLLAKLFPYSDIFPCTDLFSDTLDWGPWKSINFKQDICFSHHFQVPLKYTLSINKQLQASALLRAHIGGRPAPTTHCEESTHSSDDVISKQMYVHISICSDMWQNVHGTYIKMTKLRLFVLMLTFQHFMLVKDKGYSSDHILSFDIQFKRWFNFKMIKSFISHHLGNLSPLIEAYPFSTSNLQFLNKTGTWHA